MNYEDDEMDVTDIFVPHGAICDITSTEIEKMRAGDYEEIEDALVNILWLDHKLGLDDISRPFDVQDLINEILPELTNKISTATNHEVRGILVDAACDIVQRFRS